MFTIFTLIVYFNVDLTLSDDDKKRYTLEELHNMLRRNGRSLKGYTSMPQLPKSSVNDTNVFIMDEKAYDRADLKEKHDTWVKIRTKEHKLIYKEIIGAVDNKVGGMLPLGQNDLLFLMWLQVE